LLGIFVFYKFLDKGLGSDYKNAFQIMRQVYRNADYYILIAVFIQLVVGTVLVYFISLYFSHKIAGPMYRLKMLIDDYLHNKQVDKVKFRETDFLSGVAENFTHFFVYHNDRAKKIAKLKEVAKQLKSATSDEEKENLKSELKSLLKSLGE
jgi:sensor histidine kinase YesM